MSLHLPLMQDQAAEAGRGLVRVPLDQMSSAGLSAGDTVALTGTRTTHARVVPARRGRGFAVSSSALLVNTGSTSGDLVALEIAELGALESVILQLVSGDSLTADDLREGLYDLPVTVGDEITVLAPNGRTARLQVISATPLQAGLFAPSTLVSLSAPAGAPAGYDEVGGLDAQIAQIHEMVAAPLLRPDLFARLGIMPPRGVLFTGPPGSGKTLLARTIAARTSAAFFQISGPEIVSKHYGESEAALRNIFASASKESPAIVFIDEIDAIAPKRDGLSGEKQVERRVVAQLLTLMDGLSDRGQLIVMAATNLPDSLDPALRRPGRFDREISFSAPDAAQREDILKIHLRPAPLAPDVDLTVIAEGSQGYVGADLAALAREAALAALDRAVQAAGGEDQLHADTLFIEQADLLRGLTATSPSVLRDTHVESPVVKWEDVGGMEAVKDMLQQAVIWPQTHAASFSALRLAPVRGILLSGPPGTGKTLIARALAHESASNFIPVRPTRIISQFLGDAERAISEVFAKARQSAPTLIFFDELDALAPRRGGQDATLNRIVAQLLTEMDGLVTNAGITVLAATNRAEAIDPALLRPGRFDLAVPVPLPDAAARKSIVEVHLKHLPGADQIDLDAVVQRAQGLSGADLAQLVSFAARCAVHRSIVAGEEPRLGNQDFEAAIDAHAASSVARSKDFVLNGAET